MALYGLGGLIAPLEPLIEPYNNETSALCAPPIAHNKALIWPYGLMGLIGPYGALWGLIRTSYGLMGLMGLIGPYGALWAL